MFEGIASYLKPSEAYIGVVLENLKSGERLEIHPNRQFKSASVIKNVILRRRRTSGNPDLYDDRRIER